MKSVILKIDKREFQELFDKCSSKKQILKSIGLRPFSYNYKLLDKKTHEDNIDLLKFNENFIRGKKEHINKLGKSHTTINFSDVFVENSSYNRNTVRRIILNNNLLEYKCNICNNTGTHMNKELVLHIDHINGIHDDHRIENLRWICPNCHSQTETYSGKNNKINKKYYCKECNCETKGHSDLCRGCSRKSIRKFDISKDELKKMMFIEGKNLSVIGKKFGVSANAIKKRCELFGITFLYNPKNRILMDANKNE